MHRIIYNEELSYPSIMQNATQFAAKRTMHNAQWMRTKYTPRSTMDCKSHFLCYLYLILVLNMCMELINS
jgi:hypothetical protein